MKICEVCGADFEGDYEFMEFSVCSLYCQEVLNKYRALKRERKEGEASEVLKEGKEHAHESHSERKVKE